MRISFDFIPNIIRVPGAYAEIDPSRAARGLLPAFNQRILVLGQRLAAGTVAAEVPTLILTGDAASEAFGRGSMLHRMFQFIEKNNGFTETVAVALDDLVAGALATGSIAITGPATASGTLSIYIGARRVRVGVSLNDSANSIATAVAAAIVADDELPVTAAAAAAAVNLTARHKGENGNDIDVRLNYFFGEALPAGVAPVVTAMAGGTGNPDIADAIAAIGDEQYDYLIVPWTDAANMAVLDAELASRWQPLREIEGHAFLAKVDTVANLSTFGNARNSPHVSVMGMFDTPTPPEEIAAAFGAVAAFHLNQDPARPLQTLPLVGVLSPPEESRFTTQEANILLFDGVATARIASDGTVLIERAITTYQQNAFGSPDIAFLDVQTPATLAFLRKSWRVRMLSVFPRHKLRNDGIKDGSGQAIVTPKIARGETIALMRQWESAGLVENVDATIPELIVERDISDPNRLNFRLPPDLVNQLRVMAAKIEYLL